jgi:hypothetical protein
VEFESFGTDRRLATDFESGLFRIVDEAIAAFREGGPERVVVSLDWADGLEARVRAVRRANTGTRESALPSEADSGKAGGRLRRNQPVLEEPGAMHPQMAAMIESANRAERSTGGLPASAWREIQARAKTLGLRPELLDDGHELRLVPGEEAAPASA